VSITKSRVMKSDAPTKTAPSERDIRVFPDVLEVLRRMPVRVNLTPDDFFFEGFELGEAVLQDSFRDKVFYRALISLKIRLRPLYNTRHTFISLALTASRPPKAIAEYTGTSLAMIQRRYGRYMRDGGLEAFEVNPDVKPQQGDEDEVSIEQEEERARRD